MVLITRCNNKYQSPNTVNRNATRDDCNKSNWKDSRDCVNEILRESSYQINIDISTSYES